MSKIERANTPSARKFWACVEKAAKAARAKPAYMRGGIELNPVNFVTWQDYPEYEGYQVVEYGDKLRSLHTEVQTHCTDEASELMASCLRQK